MILKPQDIRVRTEVIINVIKLKSSFNMHMVLLVLEFFLLN